MADHFLWRVRLRANGDETTTWLACIFSWLTPYEWYSDVLITVVVGALTHLVTMGNMRREEKTDVE